MSCLRTLRVREPDVGKAYQVVEAIDLIDLKAPLKYNVKFLHGQKLVLGGICSRK